MPKLIVLDSVELIPVVEMEPFKFARQSRSTPSGTGREVPDEWYQYWLDSLADCGLIDLTPLRRGSWHVPTNEFADPFKLQKFLEATFRDWGGIESLSDPECKPVLNGGLALRCQSNDVLIEPGCCADLGDAANWREAAAHRLADWQMLWIGHPWLSVKYEVPWLIISDQHESDHPTARWAVAPDELQRAIADAEAELEGLAQRIAAVLPILGYQGDTQLMGRKLAGIKQ